MTELVPGWSYTEARARLEAVLETSPDLVNLADEEGLTPLHLAALSGNSAALEVFLSSRAASVDQLDSSGHSALHWAAVCQRLGCVRLLHHHGAEVDLPDQGGAGALHYAVQTDQAELVSLLISLGADINLRDGLGRTPVMWAASCDSLASLLLLLPARPDLELRDGQSLTALHTGAARGNLRSLRALLDHQPGLVDLPDSDGAPALFYAASRGRLDCLKLLAERSSKVGQQDRLGRTALTCGLSSSSSSSQVVEVLQVLLSAGADLAVTTEEGDSLLHLATARRQVETVVWLLTNSPVLINKENRAGLTPLHLAASLNHLREVSHSHTLTATLFPGCYYHQLCFRICKVLLDFHCHCNPVMRCGRRRRFAMMTPVDIALAKHYIGCCKLLQLHGGLKWTELQRLRSQSDQLVRVMSAPSLR